MDNSSPQPKKTLLKRFSLKPVNRRARRIEKATLRHAHRFVIQRLSNLRSIRRHIIGWLVLVILLIGLTTVQLGYDIGSVSTLKPISGGTYAAGIVDSVTTLNPLFATTQAELSADKLIFSGLLEYDNQGVLQGDLTQSWQINKTGTEYTVTLKPGLTWQDGQPLTAADVVATVKTMQNPAVGALDEASWKGISVKALNPRQVVFDLPNPYAPFASALTFAVLPRHIISKIAPEDLRQSSFSSNPVGSGPFRFVNLKTIDVTAGKSALEFEAFNNYWDGPPQVARFSLYIYSQPEDLINGLKSHEINAASDVSSGDIKKLSSSEFNVTHALLNSAVYSIFRTDSPILKDVSVRQALVQGLDRSYLQHQLGVQALDSPVISTQLPQATSVKQSSYNENAAKSLLAAAGWKKGASGYLEKNGQPLELSLVTVNNDQYKKVVSILKQQWSKLGIKLDVQIVDPEQVEELVLKPRAYDILVYELELGGDPDSYAYWDSSQIVGAGLNLADYSSPLVDDALVTARIRSDPALRDAKYTTFAQQWVKDVPAISLYQASLTYVTAKNVTALRNGEHLPTPIDRYTSVDRWTVQNELRNTTP